MMWIRTPIVGRNRDWVVDPPVKGFLFPAFNDRTADIHQALYFTKKPEELRQNLSRNCLEAIFLFPRKIRK